jgi:hypothetical protein
MFWISWIVLNEKNPYSQNKNVTAYSSDDEKFIPTKANAESRSQTFIALQPETAEPTKFQVWF